MLNSAKFVTTRHSGGGGFYDSSKNSGSGSFFDDLFDQMKQWKEYRQTHDAHFPLQDYLEGSKAGVAVDKVVDFMNDTAHAPDEFFNELGKAVDSGISSAVSVLRDNGTSVQSGVTAKPVIYSDWSPASRLFGMDQDTAFSEHIANTAHQREVADLKAAGLNPVLGISGSGATSLSGNASVGSSSAEKALDFPLMDVLGATAGLVTTLISKKPALGYMVSNVFKAFD